MVNNHHTSPPLFERIQRHNVSGYNHDLLREFFRKAFRMDGRYFSCLTVTERQGYYRPVRVEVDLRNLQPQSLNGSQITFQQPKVMSPWRNLKTKERKFNKTIN